MTSSSDTDSSEEIQGSNSGSDLTQTEISSILVDQNNRTKPGQSSTSSPSTQVTGTNHNSTAGLEQRESESYAQPQAAQERNPARSGTVEEPLPLRSQQRVPSRVVQELQQRSQSMHRNPERNRDDGLRSMEQQSERPRSPRGFVGSGHRFPNTGQEWQLQLAQDQLPVQIMNEEYPEPSVVQVSPRMVQRIFRLVPNTRCPVVKVVHRQIPGGGRSVVMVYHLVPDIHSCPICQRVWNFQDARDRCLTCDRPLCPEHTDLHLHCNSCSICSQRLETEDEEREGI